MSAFSEQRYRPMLIGREEPPFANDEYVFELKLDGVRCLAFVDGRSTSLVSRSGRRQIEQFPELASLHEDIHGTCVLDGELIVFENGVPVFEAAKERALSTRADRISRLAKQKPVVFVVFDVLYRDSEELVGLPFSARRTHLEAVVNQGTHLALTQLVEGEGIALFDAARERGLEGIVGKRKDSLYHPGKRTSDWVKCKNLREDDFIICGYIPNRNNTVSLVLGQFDGRGALVYCGHVVLGLARGDFASIERLDAVERPAFANAPPKGNDDAIWVERELVCRVTFTELTTDGLLRHPVYKDLRFDKPPSEALSPS